MVEVIYKRAETSEELQQILELQQRNIKAVLKDSTIKTEGYVTVEHTFDVLKRMNDACPHIIAKANGVVVGYALCMLETFRDDVLILKPMFEYMDTIIESKNLLRLKYLIMGQICIDKTFRKQGLFKKLYTHFKIELESDFDAVITEVNTKNTRSSKAHKSVGFEVLDEHTENGEDWELIIWKWH
ncbi:GNAT family N-acetyltransferase [Winogradskyella immobilis]|uniref:GNAT family N-acetyltransferase n=1 Tax=Winogradskyella immobilis TaxID=2816852 RepID=A0ABS8EQY4_9FLAO|nr:GNAT family N-acetyltransferase [Winogradskyella immobilis]MCC1485291.1 GNAT family N-acetyltransferase [Winogradskyella immobilis]MCG0017383.1 GNAT family N-acetyltransferase [Winogradskyella immobilis]